MFKVNSKDTKMTGETTLPLDIESKLKVVRTFRRHYARPFYVLYSAELQLRS